MSLAQARASAARQKGARLLKAGGTPTLKCLPCHIASQLRWPCKAGIKTGEAGCNDFE